MHPKQPKRFNPLIHASIITRPSPELILRKVQIPIKARAKRIGPLDPRIPDKRPHGPVLGVVDVDSVLLERAQVDIVVGVCFQTVGYALLGQSVYGLDGLDLGEGVRGAMGAEGGGGRAVESARGDGGPVEGFAVGGEGDAIGSEGERGNGQAGGGSGVGVDGFAVDLHEEVG